MLFTDRQTDTQAKRQTDQETNEWINSEENAIFAVGGVIVKVYKCLAPLFVV